ncbi:MAG: [protein-PII] uridylyltransferase [Actinobacteria bacterium]|nr:[protein-PII] uridylyltransferase [Actinomycetota bacterium]
MTTSAGELRRRRAAVIADGSLQGRASCRALAGVTDQWLAERFTEVTAGLGRRAALVAVGGYGRAELAPGSDLDLWLVHDGRPGADLTELAEALWYPVWDAGLKLGHAVCTLRQGLALAAGGLDTATATLTARSVAGDATLAVELREAAAAQWRKRSSRWLAELGRRVAERHERAGEVAFLLEPNLKEGRGGLRDVHALEWAQAARPVLLNGDAAALTAAEETLLAARVELHRLTGRANDELLLERQDEVAAALGDIDADALMARVAGAARTVAWTADEVWRRLSSSLAGPLGRLSRRDHRVGPGLVLRDGEVHVERDVDITADPAVVLRAAAVAAQSGVPIDRSSLDRLAEDAPVLDSDWPEGCRAALVDLLASGHAAVNVLEALDQRDLLHRVLPEWEPTRSKPQRNAYHRFTVDRHLCETAANAAGLSSRVDRPDLLLVGAWLHDLGKGYPGDHTEVGMELMATVAPRMGFGTDDTSTLVAMVRHHLLLPDVATRRDLADDDVIHGVAEAVGSLSTLDLLAALTEADSLATGPSAWGSWKAGLVAQLVERVAHVLRGGEAQDLRGDGFPGDVVRRLMAGTATVVEGDGEVLTVVAPDRPGLFSRVAGALALKGLAVRSADAASRDGRAASQFRVEAGPGGFEWDDVTATVRRALAGRLALDARLAERSRTTRRASPGASLLATPRVRIDNSASGSSTVVEVRAPDRIGVLYRVTAALAELDLDIRLAKVATLGSEVIDTFYVTTSEGAKVVDRADVGELERAVAHSLTR